MEFIRAILNALSLLRTTSQLEYHIRCKQPQSHAELERLVRDYYSIRGL